VKILLWAIFVENFPSAKMGQMFAFSRSGGHGFEKVAIFTAKGTSLRESTSFKLFWAKIG